MKNLKPLATIVALALAGTSAKADVLSTCTYWRNMAYDTYELVEAGWDNAEIYQYLLKHGSDRGRIPFGLTNIKLIRETYEETEYRATSAEALGNHSLAASHRYRMKSLTADAIYKGCLRK
jgi:hypothetical protein